MEELEGDAALEHARFKTPTLAPNSPKTNAVDEYRGGGYMDVNNHLRGLPQDPDDEVRSKMEPEDIHNGLRAAFGYVRRTEQPLHLYRGLGNGSKLFGSVGSKVGQTFHDKGYTSTSTNHDTAKIFADSRHGALLHVHVPVGHRAMAVDKMLGDNIKSHGLKLAILLFSPMGENTVLFNFFDRFEKLITHNDLLCMGVDMMTYSRKTTRFLSCGRLMNKSSG